MTPQLRVSDVEVGLAKLLVEMNAIDGVATEPLIAEIAEAAPSDTAAGRRESIAQLERRLEQVGADTADNARKVLSLDSKVREIEASKAAQKPAKRSGFSAKRRLLRTALQRRAIL